MTPHCLALGVLVAVWAPADLSQPERTPRPDALTFDLAGTVWKGKDNDGELIMRFEAGGILDYTTHGTRYRNATWKQRGDSVYLEFNNKYAEYRGTLRGNTLSGTATNVRELRWDWSVEKE